MSSVHINAQKPKKPKEPKAWLVLAQMGIMGIMGFILHEHVTSLVRDYLSTLLQHRSKTNKRL